jgi:mono/diheme cytochrome c family protein
MSSRISALLIAALAACLVAVTIVSAASAADAANGERLAKRWCAACHVVAADQTRGSAQVPPFSAIAKRPGFDSAAVALFLLAPHPMMPNMSLSRTEAADLAVYIGTQK